MYVAIYGMSTTETFVLSQGLQGHHHLFEPCIVRMAMTQPVPDESWHDPDAVRTAMELLERLAGEDSLHIQRSLIAEEPLGVQEVLVHLYFHHLFQVMEARETMPN